IHIKYFKWISRAIKGDLGYSIYYGKPVLDIIGSRMSNTVILATFSLCLSIILGIGIGIISAIKKNTLFDKVFTTISFVGVSIPAF
ncbi:hypothetical protein L0M81_13230, partial [Alistipes putredinis]|nr:hypothetical protein [Alistipes putredinis]